MNGSKFLRKKSLFHSLINLLLIHRFLLNSKKFIKSKYLLLEIYCHSVFFFNGYLCRMNEFQIYTNCLLKSRDMNTLLKCI